MTDDEKTRRVYFFENSLSLYFFTKNIERNIPGK